MITYVHAHDSHTSLTTFINLNWSFAKLSAFNIGISRFSVTMETLAASVFTALCLLNLDSISLCQDKDCLFGAECMVTPDGSTAKCVCSQECEEINYDPVCGSDGVDYANECEMQRVGCLQRRELKLIFKGMCSKYCLQMSILCVL